MKTLSVESFLESLIAYSLPEGSKTKGLHLRFNNEKNGQSVFTHLLILRPNCSISILSGKETINLLNLPGEIHMELFVPGARGGNLAKQLIDSKFLPESSLNLDFIREVFCNSFDLPDTLGSKINVDFKSKKEILLLV